MSDGNVGIVDWPSLKPQSSNLGECIVTNDESAEAIQKRMSELRCNVASDMRDVRRSAQKMASPMFYIRRYPWASAAVAGLVGYALVPKKKKVVTPDPEMLAEMIRKEQIKVDTSKANESQSLLRSLAVMGLTWGLRTGLTYMGQRLAAAAMNAPANRETPETAATPEATTPQPEAWNAPR